MSEIIFAIKMKYRLQWSLLWDLQRK